MHLLPLLLALPLQTASVPAPSLDSIDQAALDAVVAKHEGEDRPGFTAALCRDGEVIWSNSCGEASLEWGVENGRDTVFRLASTSKQFTAAAVQMLALDGVLELDAPLAKYLPEFGELSPMPTVREMVHHTSGLRDYLSLMSIMGYDLNGEFELEEVFEVLRLQKGLNFDPGTEWSYSNSNYVLMAVIVERVSGQALPAFTDERIFGPLGMTDTLWLDDVDRVIERRAWGYMPKGDGFERSGTRIEVLGDGALASTVVDLAKWAEVLVDPPAEWAPLVAAMLDGVPMSEEEDARYGSGLMIDTFHGLPRVQHGGAFVGYRCQMTHLPEQQLTAICLSNNGDFNPDEITDALLRKALGDDLPKIAKPDVAAEGTADEEPEESRDERRARQKAKRRAPSEEEIALLVGTYTCPELRLEFAIELDERGRLQVRKPDGEDSRFMVRRETSEAITHAFSFGIRLDLEWNDDGYLVGGTLDAGRAKGMRFERRSGVLPPKGEAGGN